MSRTSRLPAPQRLAERFVAVSRLARLEAKRADRGMSAARFEFLHALFHHGPGRMGVVAERLGVSARTLTPMVDALEGEGLVARVADPTDRRAQVLELTPSGLEVVAAARRARLDTVARLFDGLAPSERAALDELLAKVIATALPGQPDPRQLAVDRADVARTMDMSPRSPR